MADGSKSEGAEILLAIDNLRERAKTKALDISLNELADMYDAGELAIRPEYQRLFRWDVEKQSQFIETLVLELPVPPIFVVEVEEGKWQLIDGLQRISTYLHFRGMLSAPESNPPISKGDKLKLEGCDILKVLNGQKFDELPTTVQVRLKRSFLHVEVVRRETDPTFRYHMFKRLNTGGEKLSEQELRNCTIRLLGERFNNFIIELSKNADFRAAVAENLSEEALLTMVDVELVLRFFTFKNALAEFKHDIAPFMTHFMEGVTVHLDGTAEKSGKAARAFDIDAEKALFNRVFKILNRSLSVETCMPYRNGRPTGTFSVYQYEAITIGVARVADLIDPDDESHIAKVKETLVQLKKDDTFAKLASGGGANRPGPYIKKIGMVETSLRQAFGHAQ